MKLKTCSQVAKGLNFAVIQLAHMDQLTHTWGKKRSNNLSSSLKSG